MGFSKWPVSVDSAPERVCSPDLGVTELTARGTETQDVERLALRRRAEGPEGRRWEAEQRTRWAAVWAQQGELPDALHGGPARALAALSPQAPTAAYLPKPS